MSALGIIASWATIVLCQIQLYRWSKKGILKRPKFRLFGAPYTSYATLVFLFGVLVRMAFDAPIGSWTIATLVVIIPALIGGWFLVRTKVLSVAEERMGYTGQYPVVANRPTEPEE